jgi:hypothetical protein
VIPSLFDTRKAEMSYALYSNGKYLGPLAPVGLLHEMTQIVERHARSHRERGGIAALSAFFEHGESKVIPKLIKDISKLLTSRKTLPPNIARAFENLKQLAMKAEGHLVIGES